jgi:hypothetical protein
VVLHTLPIIRSAPVLTRWGVGVFDRGDAAYYTPKNLRHQERVSCSGGAWGPASSSEGLTGEPHSSEGLLL